ncbi:MAG: helix-turn-helix domain-containing protein [Tropicimonas sp.]|uniref:helix-turn-helix domain-containing protein n=1 Tax=Tropicimonas sp. TaxID=2067044 RepID=UPI003A8AA545
MSSCAKASRTASCRRDLHRTYVSGVERGIRNPTVLIVAKLADALGVWSSKML